MAEQRSRLGDLVREDGSVDLPALRAKVAAAVDKVGETWSRLNGEAPARVGEDLDEEAIASAVAARKVALAVAASVDASSRQDAIDTLERELQESSKAREAVLRKEDQLGKLIRAKEIRAMDDSVSRVRRTLAVQVLALEMEKAYASLASEVEAASEPEEERLLVADFGELDLRLAPLVVFADMGEPLLIDDDDLGQLAAEIQYLKVRMGLGDDFYSATIDWPRVKKYVKESFSKTKEGAEFYFRGFKLVGGDSLYAARLIRKAALGRTLLPREVRTLRRTGRDLLAVIPFSIILIAPLTPLGHVLIFSFLQRFFPDFFPSTFNERRQALMRRHEELRKTISAATDSGEDVSQADVHLADIGIHPTCSPSLLCFLCSSSHRSSRPVVSILLRRAPRYFPLPPPALPPRARAGRMGGHPRGVLGTPTPRRGRCCRPRGRGWCCGMRSSSRSSTSGRPSCP